MPAETPACPTAAARRTAAAALAVAAVALFASQSLAQGLFDRQTVEFAARLDAGAMARLHVQHAGRITLLDTLAREQVAQVAGRQGIDGTGSAFSYLELYFNAGAYLDQPLIPVREKSLRQHVEGCLGGGALESFRRTRRLPPASLMDAAAFEHLIRGGRARAEQIGRARATPSLRDALAALSARPALRLPLERLSGRCQAFADLRPRVMPFPGGWESPLDFRATGYVTLVSEPWEHELVGAFWDLADAWLARDADRANSLVRQLSRLQRQAVEGGRWRAPGPALTQLELLYNRTYHATIVWVGFAVATALLLAAVASGRRWARLAGMGALGASTAALAAGFAARWLLSGRSWYLPPIMNQFEAVVGSALLGAMLAIALELIWRRSYFALAAAFYATVALLAGFFLPQQMGADIRAMPGILSSPIMAVHVAVIIIGHALAGMTAVISAAYLATATVVGLGGPSVPSAGADLSGPRPGQTAGPIAALAAIDRCNLITAQLAAWTVAMGTMLGAYWADFAWGRWWGWDVKETWALVTALVYVGVLHVRFVTPPRWRGLVTAILCVVGAAVMLFNWVGVNYLLTGLHSYA